MRKLFASIDKNRTVTVQCFITDEGLFANLYTENANVESKRFKTVPYTIIRNPTAEQIFLKLDIGNIKWCRIHFRKNKHGVQDYTLYYDKVLQPYIVDRINAYIGGDVTLFKLTFTKDYIKTHKKRKTYGN